MQPLTLLGVVAWSVLLAPFVVGAFALVDMQRFRREAFGGYRSSTGWFMVAVAAGLAYYTALLVTLAWLGLVEQMHAGPPTPLGWMLYLQGALSCLALLAVHRSGAHLRGILHPAPS